MKIRQNQPNRYLILLSIVTLVVMIQSCSESENTQIQTLAAQAEQTGLAAVKTEAAHLRETAQAQIATKAADVFATLVASQIRDAIIRRANSWVVAQVPYNQEDTHDDYRTDCSGFVSYAWQLQENGHPVSPDTVALGQYWTIDISFKELQSGDIVNNEKSGDYGHVVIFSRWLDDSHSKFEAYEENWSMGKAIISTLTLIVLDNGQYIIEEFELYTAAKGPYYAQKSKTVP